jgi:hypothetical protein
MNTHNRLGLSIGLLMAAMVVIPRQSSAQAFNYPDFSSTVGLNLVGDAAPFGDRLRLTAAQVGQCGGAWFSTKQAVASGFRTSFAFEVSEPDQFFGADGFVFIVQDDSSTALGVGGSSLGFMDTGDGPGLDNFLAVEFDTLNSGITFDTNDNHIAVQSLRKLTPKSREFLGSANPPWRNPHGRNLL